MANAIKNSLLHSPKTRTRRLCKDPETETTEKVKGPTGDLEKKPDLQTLNPEP